jgi:hypothetical protein
MVGEASFADLRNVALPDVSRVHDAARIVSATQEIRSANLADDVIAAPKPMVLQRKTGILFFEGSPQRMYEIDRRRRTTPPALPRGSVRCGADEGRLLAPGRRISLPGSLSQWDRRYAYCPLQWRGRAGISPASVSPDRENQL